MRQPVAIDLFAGAGGLSLGLRRAGFDIRAAADNDRFAVETYRLNLGDHMIQCDLATVDPSVILDRARIESGNCDLLAGGPPCQGFSVQRRGTDEDPRNSLVLHYFRMVEAIKPRYFLMENVSGLMSKRGRGFLDEVMRRAAELGYHLHLQKLDAAEFGVPQSRVRVILVGEHVGGSGAPKFMFPKGCAGRPRTVRDAIADLPTPPADGTSHPRFANHAREARLSPLNIDRLKHIPPGGGREDLPEYLQLPCHRNNPGHRHLDVYGRLSWDKPSGTITARFDSFTRGRFAHPEDHRSLTLREGARLQTFPDDFVFVGNREEGAKQIGNAVPPLLATVLGRSVLAALLERGQVREPTNAGTSARAPHEGPAVIAK
jgi:DNA (cytosine-5)-methyltransferase 1